MSTPIVVLEGIVRADGTLEVPEKVNLPAGKVQVTLVSLPEIPEGDSFSQRLEAMWAAQKARGHVPRSVEDVEAERRELRGETDDEIQQAIQLQEECRKARGASERSKESGA